jgi:hypothetical protein
MPAESLLDHTEATAIAAVWQSLHDGSAMPINRPSWTDPSLFSKPITQTAIVVAPPSTSWLTILSYTVPTQYFASIKQFAVATFEALDPAMQFRVMVDGVVPQGVSYPVGVDLCKDSTNPWPLFRRDFPIVLNQPQRITIEALNGGMMPQTVIAGLWGWTYPSIATERTDTSGVNDA